ncbi:NERD domain-containing protein [Caulobacter sp. NIBR1757]|uniref:NERD domain-containing protein n=1 Tax=Caulobacter sp. NIBR1757 TaxID=3016000 RepID=UPI0022F03ACE|nr:NERD domain-containing protein [Caulobacter sp. NIBR1757]WGM38659.1 hypothetical protein AMEJIAPC_01563 [Caulobacter sp. NIBR1757]
MAQQVACGAPEANEVQALKTLTAALGDGWVLLSNIPKRLAGREIDVLLVGRDAVIVVELKYYQGVLTQPVTGPWLRDGMAIVENNKDVNFLDQAEKAAQTLKGQLKRRFPDIDVYVDACVLLTHPGSSLKVDRPGSTPDAALLADAGRLIAARSKLGSAVSQRTIEQIFDFVGKSVPEVLKKPPPPRSPSAPPRQPPPPPRAPPTHSRQPPPPPSAPAPRPSAGAGLVHRKRIAPSQKKRSTGSPVGVLMLAVVGIAIVWGGWTMYQKIAPPRPEVLYASPGRGASVVNVRSGAGTGFEIVDRLPAGTPVELRGGVETRRGQGWVAVRTPSGKDGYVKETLLSPTPNVQTDSAAEPIPDHVAGGWPNDRSRPTDHPAPVAPERRSLPRRPEVADAAPSQAPQTSFRIPSPVWVQQPSLADLEQAMPYAATAAEQDGVVELECSALASGRVGDCRVMEESPRGLGFGGAGLRLTDRLQMQSQMPDGRSVAGGRVRVKFRFQS